MAPPQRQINIGAPVNGAAVLEPGPVDATPEETRERFRQLGQVDPSDPEAQRVAPGEAEELALSEASMLDNMFRLAKRPKTRLTRIDVPDPDDESKTAFSFTVHPLTDAQIEAVTRSPEVATYQKGALGQDVMVDQDQAKFRSLLIVTATIPADQERIWRNQALMREAGVASSLELVDALIPPGYKSLLVEKLDNLSGYRTAKARERILGK